MLRRDGQSRGQRPKACAGPWRGKVQVWGFPAQGRQAPRAGRGRGGRLVLWLLGTLQSGLGKLPAQTFLGVGPRGKTGAPGTALSFVQSAACTSCWYFSWSLFQAELQFSPDNDALFSNNSLTLLCSSIDQGACRPVSGLLGPNSRALLPGLVSRQLPYPGAWPPHVVGGGQLLWAVRGERTLGRAHM